MEMLREPFSRHDEIIVKNPKLAEVVAGGIEKIAEAETMSANQPARWGESAFRWTMNDDFHRGNIV